VTKGELGAIMAAQQDVIVAHEHRIKQLEERSVEINHILMSLVKLVKSVISATSKHMLQLLELIEAKQDA